MIDISPLYLELLDSIILNRQRLLPEAGLVLGHLPVLKFRVSFHAQPLADWHLSECTVSEESVEQIEIFSKDVGL